MTSSAPDPDDCCAVPRSRGDAAPRSGQAPAGNARRPGGGALAAHSGAIISAFLASACCVGPLLLALLGLGGNALLAKFEPYRPYFMVITFALLGMGFWLQYRKPKAAVEGDGCDCPAPRASRAGKIMLWVATVVVTGFLAFPYLVPVLFA